MRMVKYSQSSQNSKFAMCLQYLKKEVRDEVDFLHAEKHQSLQQIDFNILGIKLFYKVIRLLLMGMIKHFQITQSNKFAISLQCLKKEVRDRVHILQGDKHQSFYKLVISFFMEVVRHLQSAKKNNTEICLTSLCMCAHQLLRKYNDVLQCVTLISKLNQNLKPSIFQPLTTE